MTSTNIDYVKNYFQYPELTKIHGEPTYETLQVLKDQLKSNATSVTSHLGGGANGHLGLILTNAEYARITLARYNEPQFPVLTIPVPATGPVISQANREFVEAMRTYREVIDIKKSLVKQIVAAVDPVYLRTLRNDDTHSITYAIPLILEYLFHRYGKVTPDKLSTKEIEVRSFVYNLRDPLVSLFDQVEDLKKLAIAAQMPYTNLQIINFGVQLIRNTHDFQDGLKSWYDTPIANQTWMNFKMHFEDEHDKLKLIRGETMKHAGFHQANHVASQVMEEVQSVQHSVLQLLQCQETNKENTPPPPEIPEQKANAVTPTDSTMLMQMEMLKLIKSLQQEVSNLKNNNNTNNENRNNPNYRGRTVTNRYCWTHGATNHSSKDCRFKRQNHKDEATFSNKMDGSTRYCKDTSK